MYSFDIDKQSPIPYYFQIEEWIRELITTGKLQPGDKLPPETTLCKNLGVSRLTLRHALLNLTNEGLLFRKRALGTFVAFPKRQIPIAANRLGGLTDEMAKRGSIVHSRVLNQQKVPAVDEILRNLQLSWNDTVIQIQRLRSVNETPIVIETCYFPYKRFPELLTMDMTDQSIYQILDEKYDALPQEAFDNFIASVATAKEAGLLDITEGAPVMRYQRVAMDKINQPMEYTLSIYRADQYQFVIRYQRDEVDE
jgi:GntR family transcriptional regulator